MPPNRAQFTCWELGIDEFLKSQRALVIVIPVKAEIQENKPLIDSRLCGNNGFGDFLRDHQN